MQDFDDNEINIVLLGKSGNGKSATGNTILGREVFMTSSSSSTVTKLATLECSQNELTSSLINVVDTPGLMDTDGDDTMAMIGQAMSLCPNGFNALIIVLQYGTRFTKEEDDCIKTLKQNLGPKFVQDFGIIIMTHGDSFTLKNPNTSFTEWCRDESEEDPFGQLLAECNGRCVLFYNKGIEYEGNRKKYVSDLLNIIKNQISSRFKCRNFEVAVETRKILLENIDMPQLHKQIQEKMSLLDELLHKNINTYTFAFDEMKKHIQDLHRTINDLPDSPQTKIFRGNIKSVTDKLCSLKGEQDIKRRKSIQMSMKKHLRILKYPPSKSPVIIANIKLVFAKVAYPVGIVCSFGLAADFLRNWLFEKKIDLEMEEKYYEKQAKKHRESKEWVEMHSKVLNG